MARAWQVRASVQRWIGDRITLDTGLVPADQVAYQARQESSPNEWRFHWSGEIPGGRDQTWRQLVQVDRCRADGDEAALAIECGQLLETLGLTVPGRGVAVGLYAWPDDGTRQVGTASVSRLSGKGWDTVPDPAQRLGHLRAIITLAVDYSPS